MTIITVLLIGAGTLLIASALDGSSLKDTFTKIMNGEPVNWSGTSTVPAGPAKSAGAAGGGSSTAG